MITRKVAPALAAGCTMVLKPAEQTRRRWRWWCRAERAGVPPGVFNVVTGEMPGDALTASPVVRA